MKRFICYLTVYLITFPMFGQWTDKGDYKELKVANTLVTKLIVPPTDSLFFILTKDLHYLKFDYLGNLISNKTVPAKIGNEEFTSINSDGNFLFYSSKYIGRIRMIDADTHYQLWDNEGDCQNYGKGFSNYEYIYYNTFSGNMIFTFTCFRDFGSGSTGYENNSYGGLGYLKKSLKDTNIIISGGSHVIVETDLHSKKYFFTGVGSFEIGRPGESGYVTGCSTYLCFYHIEKNKLYSTTNSCDSYWGVQSEKHRYLVKNTTDGFIEINQKNIKEIEIINGKPIEVNNFNLDFVPLFIILSANDRFLIAVDYSYGIWIIDVKTKSVMRKYPKISDSPILDLKLTLQGGGFFTFSKDAMLRLYSLPYLTDIEESNQSQEFYLFPNPASDYISISLLNPMLKQGVDKVEIYSIEGILMKSTSPQPSPFSERAIQLDVSGFVPGIYFVKIGDRVQRFVKM